MRPKRNNKLLAVVLLFIFILSFSYGIFYIKSNSLNKSSVRKLKSEVNFIKYFRL